MARDWRDDRIDELERENAALRARICELEARIRELEARLVAAPRPAVWT